MRPDNCRLKPNADKQFSPHQDDGTMMSHDEYDEKYIIAFMHDEPMMRD
jgi:hypothetical protein